MKDKLIRFMIGRNGSDKLGRATLYASIALLLVGMFFRNSLVGDIIRIISTALLIYSYFRILSKNIYKRREENEKFIRLEFKIKEFFRVRKLRWQQRKDYKFFSCPDCKAVMRVPKGKGNVKIVCSRCGRAFTGKS